MRIPKIIWQTYKSLEELPPISQRGIRSWKIRNPDWDYRFQSDAEIHRFFQTYSGGEFLLTFEQLPLGVMRADLWRYAVLHEFGGVYTDIDTICNVPIERWLKPQDDHLLHVGREGNTPLFCQWTMAAPPGHPVSRHALEIARERIAKTGGVDETMPHYVHHYTGPDLWTAAIERHLGVSSNQDGKRVGRMICREQGLVIYGSRFFSRTSVFHQNASFFWRQSGGYASWLEERKDGTQNTLGPVGDPRSRANFRS